MTENLKERNLDIMGAELNDSPAPAVICALLHEMGGTKDIRALSLIASFITHEDTTVRAAAVDGLKRLRTLDAMPFFVEAFADKTSKVKNAALASIRRFSRADAVKSLNAIVLKGGRHAELAIEILARLGDPMSHQTLISLLDNDRVRLLHGQIAGLLAPTEGLFFTIKYKTKAFWRQADPKMIGGIVAGILVFIIGISVFLFRSEYSLEDSSTAGSRKKKTASAFKKPSTGIGGMFSGTEKRHVKAAGIRESFDAGVPSISFGPNVPQNFKHMVKAEFDKGLEEAKKMRERGYMREAELKLGEVLSRIGDTNPYLSAMVFIELAEIYKEQGRTEDCNIIVEEYLKNYNRIHINNLLSSMNEHVDPAEVDKLVDRLNAFFPGKEQGGTQ